jgi:hypothetical protein
VDRGGPYGVGAKVILDHLHREPIPSLSLLLLISTLLLGIGATIFTLACPPRIREFNRDQWRDQLGHSLLSERLKILEKRIRLQQESKRALKRQRVADARQRIRDEQERIERERRRVEREKTPLGRLANRLEAKGYRPKPWEQRAGRARVDRRPRTGV